VFIRLITFCLCVCLIKDTKNMPPKQTHATNKVNRVPTVKKTVKTKTPKQIALEQLWKYKEVRRKLMADNANELCTLFEENMKAHKVCRSHYRRWHELAWELPIDELPRHFDLMWNEFAPLVQNFGNDKAMRSMAKSRVPNCEPLPERIVPKIHFTALSVAVVGLKNRRANGIYVKDKLSSVQTRPVFNKADTVVGEEGCIRLYFFEYTSKDRGWFIGPSIGAPLDEVLAASISDVKYPYGQIMKWKEGGQDNPGLMVKAVHCDRFKKMAGAWPCRRFERGECALTTDCPFQHNIKALRSV